MTQETLDNLAVLSVGQQLKNAREALGLSIEEVAQQTNLKKNHIDSLENDIFILQNVPPAFVRGYVRNYVRFLRLPESLISDVNYGEVTIPKSVQKVAPMKPLNPSRSTGALKYLTLLILLGAACMTGIWWWQDYQKQQQERDQLVSAEVQNEQQSAVEISPKSETAQSIVLDIATNSNDTAIDTAQSVQTTPITPSVDNASNTVNMTPAEVVATPANAPETVQTAPAVNILQQSVENNTPESSSVESNSTENQTVAISDELRIEVSGSESWIAVRGKGNKRLAEKLYKQGDVLNFNDNETYLLTIGAPINVKLYYKGQEVPLKVDGRVARIRLPQ